MSSVRSTKIWRISQPLSTFVVAQAEALQTQTPLKPAGLGWQMFEFLFRAADSYIGQNNAIDQTRSNLRQGVLVATGLRDAPSSSTYPVIIAPEAFVAGALQVLRNALIGAQYSYGDIRVIAKSDIPISLLAPRPNQEAHQSEIFAIIRNVQKAGLLTGLRKQHVDIVRTALSNAKIKNIGTDKTIERQIRSALNYN